MMRRPAVTAMKFDVVVAVALAACPHGTWEHGEALSTPIELRGPPDGDRGGGMPPVPPRHQTGRTGGSLLSCTICQRFLFGLVSKCDPNFARRGTGGRCRHSREPVLPGSRIWSRYFQRVLERTVVPSRFRFAGKGNCVRYLSHVFLAISESRLRT